MNCECCDKQDLTEEDQEAVDGEIVCLDCFFGHYHHFVCGECGDVFAPDEGDGDTCADCLYEEEQTNE